MRYLLLVLGAFFLIASTAHARDDKYMYDIKLAMETEEARAKLDKRVKFYFGEQSHPAVAEKRGTFTANRKTNAFGKSDNEACRWVFLSALIALQDRALEEGGDAVIDIHSYYDKNIVMDSEKYECHAGNVIAGVALRGTVVKLK